MRSLTFAIRSYSLPTVPSALLTPKKEGNMDTLRLYPHFSVSGEMGFLVSYEPTPWGVPILPDKERDTLSVEHGV